MADKHAEYSPSRLKGIMACPGVVQLTRQAKSMNRIVDQQNTAAKRGSMLHEVMESILTDHGSVVTAPPKELVEKYIINLEDDEQEQILLALDNFYSIMSRYEEADVLAWHLELEVSLKGFGIPEVFGTSDLLILIKPLESDAAACIHGWDWKFGRFKVHAVGNHQLQAYKHGGFAHFEERFSRLLKADTPIHMHIVQPAIEHHDTWTLGLDPDWLDEVKQAIHAAEADDPPYNPSEENCLWCACRSFCKVRLEQIQAMAMNVFEAYAVKPEMWDEEQVQYLLGMLEVLAGVRKGILEDYEQRLSAGQKVPGFKLVQGQGRRQFIDYNKVIEFLDEKHPDVDAFATKPKSPAQLEKALPLATRRSAEFLKLIQTVHGTKMVRAEETGDAILRGTAAAQEAFKEFA